MKAGKVLFINGIRELQFDAVSPSCDPACRAYLSSLSSTVQWREVCVSEVKFLSHSA